VDFFTVPTIRFQVLYVFLVLAHDRRRIVHVNVTAHPTAAWTVQQLRDAFPWNAAPPYLLRDRDGIFGTTFRADVEAMGIKEVLSAPHAPWQRAYVERAIGSIRRECLDHVIVLNEVSLRQRITTYLGYYHEWRTHLPGQGRSRPTNCATASLRQDRPGPARRRFAPPLRTSRRLNRRSRYHLQVPALAVVRPRCIHTCPSVVLTDGVPRTGALGSRVGDLDNIRSKALPIPTEFPVGTTFVPLRPVPAD